jgi:hypothetical protein
MESFCGGFVNIHRGAYSITQFNPKIWNNLKFGIWDGGGDELILTIIHYSKYSDKIFRVFKQDGITPEALAIFNTMTHPENVVYLTPSIHSSLTLPPNIKVLYSAWKPNYMVYTPPLPKVEHTIMKVCFRGQTYPLREQLCEAFKDHPFVDFKITKGSWHPEFRNDPNFLPLDDQRKYRGLVSVQGGGGHPSNLEWVLGSGCVPVVHSDFHTGLQMDMKPWVHYVPLTDEGVRWIFDNPEKADVVIQNALRLHKNIKYTIHKQLSDIV